MYNEEYTKENKIWDKTEKEKNQELIMNIFKTKMELNTNIKNYVMNLTDDFTYLNMHEYMLNSMLNENNTYFNKYTDFISI